MAGRSPAMERLSTDQLNGLKLDIACGDLSWRALGEKYAVPHTTIRDFAARERITRSSLGYKRALVNQSLAAADVVHGAHPTEILKEHANDSGARMAEREMRLGLHAARQALSLAAGALKVCVGDDGTLRSDKLSSLDLKRLSIAVGTCIGTIRIIRGLNVPISAEDVEHLSDADLEDLRRGRLPR